MATHTTPICDICDSEGIGYDKFMFLAVTPYNVAEWYPKFAAPQLQVNYFALKL
jgi:hypothetical protein